MTSSEHSIPAERPTGALSPASFASTYGLGMTKTFELLKSGELRAKKVGRRTLIAREEAARWWDSLPEVAR